MLCFISTPYHYSNIEGICEVYNFLAPSLTFSVFHRYECKAEDPKELWVLCCPPGVLAACKAAEVLP